MHIKATEYYFIVSIVSKLMLWPIWYSFIWSATTHNTPASCQSITIKESEKFSECIGSVAVNYFAKIYKTQKDSHSWLAHANYLQIRCLEIIFVYFSTSTDLGHLVVCSYCNTIFPSYLIQRLKYHAFIYDNKANMEIVSVIFRILNLYDIRFLFKAFENNGFTLPQLKKLHSLSIQEIKQRGISMDGGSVLTSHDLLELRRALDLLCQMKQEPDERMLQTVLEQNNLHIVREHIFKRIMTHTRCHITMIDFLSFFKLVTHEKYGFSMEEKQLFLEEAISSINVSSRGDFYRNIKTINPKKR